MTTSYGLIIYRCMACIFTLNHIILGDNDAVLVLLLVPRLLWKCEVLLSQVRDKFPAVQTVDKTSLTSGHTVQQFSSRCFLAMHIHNLQVIFILILPTKCNSWKKIFCFFLTPVLCRKLDQYDYYKLTLK